MRVRHAAVLAVVMLALPAAASAASVEKDIRSRWLGAWVVTRAEMYSNCNGLFTGNRVNGTLVSGRGARRFRGGEVAKVTKVDAGRSRIDVRISLAEPVLLARQEGPFTLFDEAGCLVELEIEVPRDQVKGEDIQSLDRQIGAVLERHSTAEDARASRAWNKRTREPYPEDYERTLRAHAAWKAEQQNAQVQAKFDEAARVSEQVTGRVSDDPEYLRGFADGVQAAREAPVTACPEMMAANLKEVTSGTVTLAGVGTVSAVTPYARGFGDGRRLVVGLALLRGLPACFVEVPAQ
jgi:hypothetical protein